MNTQFRREIKLLLQAGLLIFSFTVVVGILNGLDEFDRHRHLPAPPARRA